MTFYRGFSMILGRRGDQREPRRNTRARMRGVVAPPESHPSAYASAIYPLTPGAGYVLATLVGVFPPVRQAVACLLLLAVPVLATAGPSKKLDRALQHVVASKTTASQRVIISGRAACLTSVRTTLIAHGDRINA